MISTMARKLKEALIFMFLAMFSKANGEKTTHWSWRESLDEEVAYCSSWRLAVEVNNVRAWRTVPTQCLSHVESYMMNGQYNRDLDLIVDQIFDYVNEIQVGDQDLDAWILDVDDTCISNLFYYKGKRFGGDPYDPVAFKTWASKGACPAIPAILRLFNMLVENGFKVFLLTGRDQESLGQPTLFNLHRHGFVGYERLILRTGEHKGKSAVKFKSEIRRQLIEDEGYVIWGNVGDQWSDLQGECFGNRTFKLPNPMYFVP